MPKPAHLTNDILMWYESHRRHLPWRSEKGATSDPYVVWLSEIMLQQTTVAAVKPYFQKFMARWPSLQALAQSELDSVLTEWAGLGYYARARNLHKCANLIVKECGGRFPESEEELKKLPGIGPYTAAAITAIAFNRPAVVVDGNVERVIARLFNISDPLPGAKNVLKAKAAELTSHDYPGDYAQAIMDLGATICKPRNPSCALCPWHKACEGLRCDVHGFLPLRSPKKPKSKRYGVAFWILDSDGSVLLRRRREKGLLGGMMEIPSSTWRELSWGEEELEAEAPVRARWRPLKGLVSHTFTHFHLELRVLAATVLGETAAKLENAATTWVPIDQLGAYALPSVMKKIVTHALKTEYVRSL